MAGRGARRRLPLLSAFLQSMIGKRVLDLNFLPEADRKAYQVERERLIAEQFADRDGAHGTADKA